MTDDEATMDRDVDWESLDEVRKLDRQLNHVPIDPFKRTVDIVVSSSCLLFFLPFFLFLYCFHFLLKVIRPQDYGNFFWYETRISEGEPFEILKFAVVKQSVLARASKEQRGHVKTLEKDRENLTLLGKLVVMIYMDELPQLINVLKGDMSLVGPRPWPVELVESDREKGLRRKELIRPGLTGPAQVSKGYPDEYQNSLAGDYSYLIYHATHGPLDCFLFDLSFIGKTIRVLIDAGGY